MGGIKSFNDAGGTLGHARPRIARGATINSEPQNTEEAKALLPVGEQGHTMANVAGLELCGRLSDNFGYSITVRDLYYLLL